MHELHKIAQAYYDSASDDIKQSAKEFFIAMDKNRNNEVTLPEFLAFMTKEGYQRMSNREFFTKLNSGKDGALRFWDVMTLYYIINSGRPFCDGCGEFIEGMYFTCTKCFKLPDSAPFNVCPTCFCDNKDFVHDHRELLDNFALLEAKRIESQANTAGTTASSSSRNALTPRRGSKSNVIVPLNPSFTSNAIVPVNPQREKKKWMTALVKVVDMGLSVGNIASNMCSIM